MATAMLARPSASSFMGASRFVIFGGRYLQPQLAAAASFHAHAEKMSIGGNATSFWRISPETAAISTQRKVLEACCSAAWYRGGRFFSRRRNASLDKTKNVSDRNALQKQRLLENWSWGGSCDE
jgi:hypothetical protein